MVNWKKIWDAWDIRVVILFSLTLQIILIFFAPFRKRVSTYYLTLPLWCSYLLVEWAANFAVGHISDSNKGNGNKSAGENKVEDVLVFWAAFLLVHLGGPDTISAFALEDNTLWHRHFLGLLTQGGAVAYVFFATVSRNKLWIPAVLIYVSGVIKYGERIWALYLASLDRFRESIMKDPDPGPNYAKLMDEYSSKIAANLPTNIEMIHEYHGDLEAEMSVKRKNLSDVEIVEEAHYFFEKFKGLIVDLIFDFRQRNESRNFFLSLEANDAFRVIEVELNFIYDVLFTKMIVANTYWGYVFRLICFLLEVAAAILFYRWDKRGLPRWEIGVSYILLLGALILDFSSFLMLLFSDWTAVVLKKKGYVLPRLPMPFRWLSRRWAESVSQFNLINYCVRGRSKFMEFIYRWLGFIDVLNRIMYVKSQKFTDELKKFIYEEIKNKSSLAEDLDTAKEIWLAKGDWTLRANSSSHLLPYITESNFDEILLVWHIATELCYSIVIDGDKAKSSPEKPPANYREMSKILSDYMLYLLVMQPAMMSAVAGIGQIRYRDTCAEAEKFFRSRNIISSTNKDQGEQCCNNFFTCSCLNGTPNEEDGQVQNRREKKHESACKAILGVNAAVRPVQVKGDRSKSALFDGRRLAKELDELLGHGINKWELISKVWVEMLSHAAINCKANNHCNQLSKGGQLVTLVWLLMTHFGLGNNFQIGEGHARAKLIVGLARILALRRDLFKGVAHEPLVVIGPEQIGEFHKEYINVEDLDMLFLDCKSTMGSKWDDMEAEDSFLPHCSKRMKLSTPADDITLLKWLKKVLSEAGLVRLISFPVVHCPEVFGVILESAERLNRGKVVPGWKVVYSGDTRPCSQVIEASLGATILIHEATFEDGLVEEAIGRNHSTIKEAIEVGDSAGAYRVILTHFSQRYPKVPALDEVSMQTTCIAFDLISVNLADLPLLPMFLPYLKLLFRNSS
ncbi:hypothetical protein P3S67_022077 [Capsicum chacoense]